MIIRSNGTGAYLSGDLAYYLDKRERGFDRCFIMLGADHHGYVGRMMAMCAAFGDEPHVNLEILIGQLVNLLKDGEPLRMSKRAGTVVTIDDLVDAIGVDAARYALARYHSDSPIDIDLDLWARASNDNPVFYGAVRPRPGLQPAAQRGRRRRRRPESSTPSCSPTTRRASCSVRSPSSRAWSRRPPSCANRIGWRATSRRWRAPTTGSTTTAGCCRWATRRSADLHRARLMLVEATRVVLANGLGLLGVSAPERM